MTPEEFIDMLRGADVETLARIRWHLGISEARRHWEMHPEEKKADEKRWADEIVRRLKEEGKF